MTTRSYISKLFKTLDKDCLVITSTGLISREAWSAHQNNGYKFGLFPMVGSMGCAVSIALGIAHNCPSKRVLCLTGDGSLLMKLGSLATVLELKPKNLEIIVLNNDCHDSTGGQYTNFKEVRDFVEKHCLVIDIDEKSKGRPLRPEHLIDIRDDFREHFHNKV